jgi:hypothetical protein
VVGFVVYTTFLRWFVLTSLYFVKYINAILDGDWFEGPAARLGCSGSILLLFVFYWVWSMNLFIFAI